MEPAEGGKKRRWSVLYPCRWIVEVVFAIAWDETARNTACICYSSDTKPAGRKGGRTGTSLPGGSSGT